MLFCTSEMLMAETDIIIIMHNMRSESRMHNVKGQNFCTIYSRGLLFCGISWFMANPFVFNMLPRKNVDRYIPQTTDQQFSITHYILLLSLLQT